MSAKLKSGYRQLLILLTIMILPLVTHADDSTVTNLAASWPGITSLIIFLVAYTLVISEEILRLRKSIPVIIAAGIIWLLVAIAHARIGNTEHLDEVFSHDLLEYAQLFLFLLAAMTYINWLPK